MSQRKQRDQPAIASWRRPASCDDVAAPAVAAIVALVRAVPATARTLSDHIACNHELLPQVLMADLRQLAVYLVAAGECDTLADFVREIERLASSDDPSVRNLVDVCFIEALVLGDRTERAALRAIRTQIGPATAASLKRCERQQRS